MKKNSLLMFADYLLVLFLSVFGIFIFSWMLSFSWGYLAYSLLFSLIFFGMIYSRAWKTAKKELKNKERKPSLKDGIIIVIPFLALNILIIAFYTLVYYNIIPIRDSIVNVVYSFPENAPRIRSEVFFISYLTPIVRIWFAPLIGFMKDGATSPLTLLLSPAITVCASLLGYYLGMKKYYISDGIVNVTEKVKEKFNE